MDIVLIAGLWLPATVWDRVADELRRRGHRPTAVTLPGVDDGSTTATLEDQLAAVLAVVDDAGEQVVVVGHSAASTLAWLATDRRPDAVATAVMIGGFPNATGTPYADFFAVTDGIMAFPGWGPFEGPDSDDLDASARRHLESIAVPVPESVARATVELVDERRYAVPVTLVCPEFGPDEARAWLADGQLPELARTDQVRFVDIDSGHWPMITRPEGLAEILDDIATTNADVAG
ncbi:MAG: alpha/beta fold hydrolase [Ilumatobacter sp.]|uniref:alpha/beta fold hydrolase n=1 Tax=Ilumatobacter sp. TaxID=1967498 RepID=UPI0032985172